MSFPFNNVKGLVIDAETLGAGVLRVALQRAAYLVEAVEQDADVMTDLSVSFDEPVDVSYARQVLTGVANQKDDVSNRIDLVANKAVFSSLAGADVIYGAVVYLDPDGTDTESQNVPWVFVKDLAPKTTDGNDYTFKWNGVDGLGPILRGV